MNLQAPDVGPTRWARRLGWLIVIWLMSVLALGVGTVVFRMIMASAGLSR